MAITLQADGNYETATSVWTASSIVIRRDNLRNAVYQFTGLPAADVDDLATGFTLVLPQLQESALGDGTIIEAYGVTSRLADPANGVVDDYMLTASMGSFEPPVFPVAAADWTLTGSLALTASAASRAACGAFNQAWRSVYRDSGGALARTLLVVVKVTAGVGGVFGDSGTATLAVTTATARTGLVGTEYVSDWNRGRGRRLIECPKSGFDIPEDEAVMDGYTRQLVDPDYYDPPDRRRPRRKGDF